MKPIKLTIQAFQSYLDKTEIDFTKLGDKGLFLVDGETGAGKSTIFQAIYYALYKEFLNSGGKGCVDIVDKDIRNINAPDKMKTIVDLIFEEKGNYYHVNRTINKKRIYWITSLRCIKFRSLWRKTWAIRKRR